MPLNHLYSAAFIGLEVRLVDVEVDLTSSQTSTIRIVGLPDAAVKEAKDRVHHALKNSGYSMEAMTCTIHLAPAELKKMGAFYDLPMALGIVEGLGVFSSHVLRHYLIGGELGLAGELRPIMGTLSLALLAKKLGKKGVIVPEANAQEASLVPDIEIIAVKQLSEAIDVIKTGILTPYKGAHHELLSHPPSVDISEIKGQAHAKRALEIAAAGKHNVLLCGPPGTGKTLLAKSFIGILPPLTFEEMLEVMQIQSLSGSYKALSFSPPFRAPHHTISYVGMVGGGSHPKPGEISLAHRGVLFLDELPEFSRPTLEALRQPLENKEITVSRAGGKVNFPTDFIFIAAMNPCPCGFQGHPKKSCHDTSLQIARYRQKISGPLLDRIDIHITVPPIDYIDFAKEQLEESSHIILQRVMHAREILNNRVIPSVHQLTGPCQALLKEAMEAFSLSPRSFKRIIKVAHTIAALDDTESIGEKHLSEALSYRSSSN